MAEDNETYIVGESKPKITVGLLGAELPDRKFIYRDDTVDARLAEIERRILAIESEIKEITGINDVLRQAQP